MPDLDVALAGWLVAGAIAVAALTAAAMHGVFAARARRLRDAIADFERSGDAVALRVAAAGTLGAALAPVAAGIEAMADRVASQAAALAAKEREQRELLANVSHDLRTPLASIQGYLELLLLGHASLASAEARNHLETAVRQSERLGRLVADLFELTRLESGEARAKPEEFALAELAHDVAQKFAADAARRGVRLEARVVAAPSAPQLRVRADIGLVERVLDNLVENALRHTPAGGRVILGVDRVEPGWVRFTVADTGPGFPADQLPGLFDRFTKSEMSGGSGLGLAIARDLVLAHGGAIEAANRPEGGAAVSFRLPAG